MSTASPLPGGNSPADIEAATIAYQQLQEDILQQEIAVQEIASSAYGVSTYGTTGGATGPATTTPVDAAVATKNFKRFGRMHGGGRHRVDANPLAVSAVDPVKKVDSTDPTVGGDSTLQGPTGL